ncbi:DUF1992 domain-containing protein [Aliiroseovarius subalbicans]|uniref:DnaJ family domain-containing protein n=1 Tax=Aliiroseovarius subalbicans TaxID=2925840 RepID=UPI001F573C6A|nr:DUF1992 domain-containing protein [Aliiroseovarius subalbicans]MCI2399046.1 DUF1992 domain-containing protein [Aliiroseovarius subalbicans]
MKWRDLAERRMRKAEREGQLTGLAGEGKPLPHRPGDALIDPADAVGHRIMAEAGALPQEIELKKALDAARADLAHENAPEARKAKMAEIAKLEMRYNITAEARRRAMGLDRKPM